MSQRWCFHCQGRGKVSEEKDVEEFWIRNQTGENQALCQRALTWFGPITGCTTKTRKIEKTCKKQLQIPKRKPARTPRNCVSARGERRTRTINNPSAQHSCLAAGQEDTGNLCPLCTSATDTGTGRGTWQRQHALCSLPSLSSETPPGCTPRRNVTPDDSRDSPASVLGCPQRPQDAGPTQSLSSHAGLSLHSVSLSTFRTSSSAFAEHLRPGLTPGSLSAPLHLPKP